MDWREREPSNLRGKKLHNLHLSPMSWMSLRSGQKAGQTRENKYPNHHVNEEKLSNISVSVLDLFLLELGTDDGTLLQEN